MLPRDDMLYTQTEQMSNIMLDNTKEERLKLLKKQRDEEKVKRLEAKLLSRKQAKIYNDYESY